MLSIYRKQSFSPNLTDFLYAFKHIKPIGLIPYFSIFFTQPQVMI